MFDAKIKGYAEQVLSISGNVNGNPDKGTEVLIVTDKKTSIFNFDDSKMRNLASIIDAWRTLRGW